MPQIERTLKLDDEKRRTIRRLDPHTGIGRELHHLLDCLEASEARERTAYRDLAESRDAYCKLRAAHQPVQPGAQRYSDATIAEAHRDA